LPPASKTLPLQKLRLGIIAGEASGDILGAELICALKKRCPDLEVYGIGGDEMRQAGCESLFPMEKLSVMGIAEIIKRLPELIRIRRKVFQYFKQNPPDLFIGIDAPDFNLTLEEKLKKCGIPTVHYVSPSVWAWRRGRLKKIGRAVDLMLTLFPHETEFYHQHSHITAKFVGHPLADKISLHNPKTEGKIKLNLSPTQPVIAILPGSRANEIHYLAEIFIRTAQQCLKRFPNLQFISPMINSERQKQFTKILEKIAPQLPIALINQQSREAMKAADVILLASGTATLEAMLINRPMVVAYRMSPITYLIAKLLIKTRYIALPNLLTHRQLVPEFIQKNATVENLSTAVIYFLENKKTIETVQKTFHDLHLNMKMNASEKAAEAILELLQSTGKKCKTIKKINSLLG
jgi:lipid-A-disaccharide synthase